MRPPSVIVRRSRPCTAAHAPARSGRDCRIRQLRACRSGALRGVAVRCVPLRVMPTCAFSSQIRRGANATAHTAVRIAPRAPAGAAGAIATAPVAVRFAPGRPPLPLGDLDCVELPRFAPERCRPCIGQSRCERRRGVSIASGDVGHPHAVGGVPGPLNRLRVERVDAIEAPAFDRFSTPAASGGAARWCDRGLNEPAKAPRRTGSTGVDAPDAAGVAWTKRKQHLHVFHRDVSRCRRARPAHRRASSRVNEAVRSNPSRRVARTGP
jgi:hypothetical protein